MTLLCEVGFVLSVGLLLYVLFGYPLLLGWMARRVTRTSAKDDNLRTVSVVIAVRNGEAFVADKLRSVLGADYPRELMEILVVSDGSDDRTEEIVEQFATQGVTLIRNPRRGKPAALNSGIARATNEILILTDVRQRLDPAAIKRVVACFGDAAVGAVSGELSILKGENQDEADTRLYWKYEVWMRKRMSRIDSTFGTNGPFYAMRRSLAVHIPEEALLDDVYLPLAAFFRGYRLILEESAKAYDYPTSLESEFKRKVRTQAGLFQILQFYPELLARKNRMRLHFLSGKFGRLALPYLLILIAVFSAGLPRPWSAALLVAQAVFYLIAFLDLWVPVRFPLKRFTSPIRTFLTLCVAALLGIRVFFVPARQLWKETQVRKMPDTR